MTTETFLAVWEEGCTQHPLDRALMLTAWSQPDWPIEVIADYPLGQINHALFDLRRRLFGPQIQTICTCRNCGETLDITFNLNEFITGNNEGITRTTGEESVDIEQYRFRAPTIRDLSRIVHLEDETEAAHQLMQNCQIAQTPDGNVLALESSDLHMLAPRVSEALESVDPYADTTLNLFCECCEQSFEVALDITQYLWEEISLKAKNLLQEIDALARAYGWREQDILGLTETRRKAYLEMVFA